MYLFACLLGAWQPIVTMKLLLCFTEKIAITAIEFLFWHCLLDKFSLNNFWTLNTVANDTICVIEGKCSAQCVYIHDRKRETETKMQHNGLVCSIVNGLRQMLIKTGFPARDKAAICGLKSQAVSLSWQTYKACSHNNSNAEVIV